VRRRIGEFGFLGQLVPVAKSGGQEGQPERERRTRKSISPDLCRIWVRCSTVRCIRWMISGAGWSGMCPPELSPASSHRPYQRGSNLTTQGGGNGPTANQGNYGWTGTGETAQAWNTWQQTDAITGTVSSTASGTAGTASDVTPTISGGTSPYTVTAITPLPTGFTVTASTGELAWSTAAAAGTYVLAFLVKDSNEFDGLADGREAEYEITVTLAA
jgi:hypothetical protein